MGLSGKPYQRSGGPFSRGGGGGGGRGGGGEGRGGRGGGRNGGDSRKAGRDRNHGGNDNHGGGHNNNNRRGGGGGGGRDGGRGGGGGGGPRQQAGSDVIGTLLKFMFDRYATTVYDSNTGMLNLADFKKSPDLASAQSAIDFNNVAFCKSLVATIKNSSIGIPRFMNLSGNSIGSPSNFLRALIDEGMASGILGFSFADNNIKDVGFVGVLSRFTNLHEICLQNNPINDPHYRRTLAKRIPTLTTIDMESVTRPPLSLPYPKPAVLSPDAQGVLMYLEKALFAALVEGNIQVLMATYHPDAVFSCSSDSNFSIPCQIQPGTDKSVREDFATLKHSLRDCDTNLSVRGAVNRMVKGRTQIMAALEKTAYHKKFMTHHVISPNANVSFLSGAATPMPIAIATIHGKMMWLPRAAQSETPRVALFDRTITLVPSGNGGWQVTTDILHLRRAHVEEPLFFANDPARIDRLCKQFKSVYPPAIFAAFVDISGSDKEYYELRDGIPQNVIEQCFLATGSDAGKTVRAAKVVMMKQCTPQQAHDALEAVGYDLTRI